MTARPDHRAPTLAEIADNPSVQAVYAANRAHREGRLALIRYALRQPDECHREAARLLIVADQWERAIPVLRRLAEMSDSQITAARHATRNRKDQP